MRDNIAAMASTELHLDNTAGTNPEHSTSPVLILDVSQVPYIDSAGLGALVGAQVSRQGNGRELRIVGITDRVRGVLKVTQVEKFFTYFGTIEEAERQAA